MRRSVRVMWLPAIVVSLALAGCFKLSRPAPPLRLYVLGGMTARASDVAGAPAASAPARRYTVGLRRAELASHLSDPAVMIRRGANDLIASQFHRWGGNLDQDINRALGSYLLQSPVIRSVDVAPWPTRARHDFIVQLHVARFEGIADSAARDGRAQVLAEWDIIRPLDGAVLLRGSSEDRTGTFRIADYSGLVTGLDAALSRVALEIGACLARFPNDSTPPPGCASVSTVSRE
ncbi:MAG TPA: ABC-type transport auxiliary lipoprotein family protein [Gemmatimonadaceae bacterium]|nr:ABC-type transport auxiliary lipoprotein family protein [Gemmatimonadaceae bacterium]